jgi:O-antigen/teichoic acid export membrane protein
MTTSEGKASFFRQSIWMVIATVAGGVFMSAVHFFANTMDRSEYAVFCTLLRIYLLMSIPTAGLQSLFAQQTAASLTEAADRGLAGETRAVLRATFLVWLAMAVIVIVASGPLLKLLKITNPIALWLTLVLGLSSLWMPILKGLLQGRQNFAGFGWVLIVDGVGRFLMVTVLVVRLHGRAASGMAAAVIGQCGSLFLAAWFTRHIWLRPGSKFAWQPLLRRVFPQILGTGALLTLSYMDVVFVQSVFSEDQPAFYMAGGNIGFALAQFTMPLAVVMFPKITRSIAQAQKTDALRMTLLSTAALGGCAALACSFLPELPLRVLYHRNPAYFLAAPLVPWFAWSLLIVTLVTVLVNNLLAREQFAIVPWLALIAAAYVTTLFMCRPFLVQMKPFEAFRQIVQILGEFSLLTLAVAVWHNWRPGATAETS